MADYPAEDPVVKLIRSEVSPGREDDFRREARETLKNFDYDDLDRLARTLNVSTPEPVVRRAEIDRYKKSGGGFLPSMERGVYGMAQSAIPTATRAVDVLTPGKGDVSSDILRATAGEAIKYLEGKREDIPQRPEMARAAKEANKRDNILEALSAAGSELLKSPDKFGLVMDTMAELIPQIAVFVGGMKGAGKIASGIKNPIARASISTGMASALASASSTYGPNIAEGLKRGMEYDDAEARALRRSAAQAVLDGATGSLLPLKIGPGQYISVPDSIIKKMVDETSNASAQLAIQMAGGALGEYVAAKAVGEKPQMGDMAVEAVAEALGLPFEFVGAVLSVRGAKKSSEEDKADADELANEVVDEKVGGDGTAQDAIANEDQKDVQPADAAIAPPDEPKGAKAEDAAIELPDISKGIADVSDKLIDAMRQETDEDIEFTERLKQKREDDLSPNDYEAINADLEREYDSLPADATAERQDIVQQMQENTEAILAKRDKEAGRTLGQYYVNIYDVQNESDFFEGMQQDASSTEESQDSDAPDYLFAPEREGAILLYEFEDGSKHVADGQKRVAAMRKSAEGVGGRKKTPSFTLSAKQNISSEEARFVRNIVNSEKALTIAQEQNVNIESIRDGVSNVGQQNVDTSGEVRADKARSGSSKKSTGKKEKADPISDYFARVQLPGEDERQEIRSAIDILAESPPRKPQGLTAFIKSRGGVQDEKSELSARDLNKLRIPGLINNRASTSPRPINRGGYYQKGLQLDYAREVAAEYGYIPSDASISDFVEALERDATGREAVYSSEDDSVATYLNYIENQSAADEVLMRYDVPYDLVDARKRQNAGRKRSETVSKSKKQKYNYQDPIPTELVTEATPAGEQVVMLGAEREPDRVVAERRGQQPLRSSVQQKLPGEDGGLFDAGTQDDLFSFGFDGQNRLSEQIALLPLSMAKPVDWIRELSKIGGVRREEIKWSGIVPFLEGYNGDVSKPFLLKEISALNETPPAPLNLPVIRNGGRNSVLLSDADSAAMQNEASARSLIRQAARQGRDAIIWNGEGRDYIGKFLKQWESSVENTFYLTDSGVKSGLRLAITTDMKQSASLGNSIYRDVKPEFLFNIDTLQQKVYDAAKRINPNAKVKFVSQLFGYGEGLVRSGATSTEMQPVAGVYKPAEDLILISLDTKKFNPFDAGHHELFHSVEKFLSDSEKVILEKAFPGEPGGLSREEKSAIAFTRWMRNEESPAPAIEKIFNKIRNFFRQIGNALRGLGFSSPEKIFDQVNKGIIARREYPAKPNLPNDSPVEDMYMAGDPTSNDSDAGRIQDLAESAAERLMRLQTKEEILNDAQSGLDSAIRMGRKPHELPASIDLHWFKNIAVSPRSVAKVMPEFTPTYDVAEEFMHIRDAVNAELDMVLKPYSNLKNKDNVNKILEYGRLSQSEFSPDENGKIDIVADSDMEALQNAALVKPGERIALNQSETQAYLATRQAMDHILNEYRRLAIMSFGFNPALESTPTTAKEVQEYIKKNPKSAERLKYLVENLSKLESLLGKGYTPFSRFGSHAVVVKDEMGQTIHAEWFEKDGWLGQKKRVEKIIEEKRNALIKKYPKEDGYSVSPVFELKNEAAMKEANFDLASLDSVVYAGGLSGPAYEKFRNELVKAVERRGFKSHFIRANNTPGYSPDFERAIADYIFGFASHVAQRTTSKAFDNAIAAISPVQTPKLHKYARDFVNYLQHPQEEFSRIRSIAFFQFLAGNISTAVVNLSQLLIMSFPYLSQFVSPARASAEMGKAMTQVLAAVRFNGSSLSVDVQKLPKDVRADVQKADKRGDLLAQQTYELLGVRNTKSAKIRRMRKKLGVVAQAFVSTYSAAERINRLVTYIAAHRISRIEGVQKKSEEIFRNNALWNYNPTFSSDKFAAWANDESNYKMGKVNRARIFRGAASLPMQFRQFQTMTLELNAQWMSGMLNSVNPTQREATAKAMALHLSMLFMSAGLLGLPFAENLKDIMETILSKIKGVDVDIEAEMRLFIESVAEDLGIDSLGVLGQVITRGMARGANLDVSRRLSMGEIIPSEFFDLANNEEIRFDRLLGGFAGPASDVFFGGPYRAAERLSYGQPGYDAVAELLPLWARNPIISYSWAQNGVQSKGLTVIPPEDINNTSLILKGLGFTSAEIGNRREVEWMISRASRAAQNMQSKFYRRMARAIHEGDTAEVESVKNDIREFNRNKDPNERVKLSPYYLNRLLKQQKEGYDAKSVPKKARDKTKEMRRLLIPGYGEKINDAIEKNDKDELSSVIMEIEGDKRIASKKDRDIALMLKAGGQEDLANLFEQSTPAQGQAKLKYQRVINAVS